MSKTQPVILKYIAEILLFFLFIHAFLPFLSPILFSYDAQSPAAMNIQKIYSFLCHQRVDRSLFLFGDENSQFFYSVDELKERGYIKQDAEGNFGLPFWGNDEIGYKVAFCIRDIALYSSLVFSGVILLIYMNVKKKIPRLHWILILALVLPMAIDGTFQTMASGFEFSWVPDAYMQSIWKRIITGALFGTGVAMFIFTNLKDALGLGYNN